ncbi:sulfotransferase domain-containing protein [Nisaea acidiphila]|uniref:Sulfotransferase domain-containing protein n=1 Tax=Nisaea acidiphila TaxID=1862145 RepID=A0A9J7ARQ0_9PROT|nr:sulfotransferase domain-containing protein [Nisaea acidiphila]UUX49927.1 sulfotransferase domain-containing protein [Nisaea acidiphila]
MSRIIWLASYPKSGNTWVRALLANYVLDRDNPVSINDLRGFTLSDTRPRYYDGLLDRPLPDLSESEIRALRPLALRQLADARPHDHFVKTHSQYTEFEGINLIEPEVTAGAIYIVRDPRDVAVSFAAHFGLAVDDAIERMADAGNLTTAGDFRMTTFLGSWDAHVASWTNQDEVPVCLVRYEDLLRAPEETFGKMLKVLGLPHAQDRISRAVANSAFETMKREERRDGFVERPPHMERFFRAGTAGGWRGVLTDAQIKQIERKFAPAMRQLGY